MRAATFSGAAPLVAWAGIMAFLPSAKRVEAHTIRVPEEATFVAAVEAAAPGDTVSIAPGTYPRSPDPFVKTITIEGRDPASYPTLRSLAAGGATIRRLHFEPEGIGGGSDGLVIAGGPLAIDSCSFIGGTALGLRVDDDGPGDGWSITVSHSDFAGLARAVDASLSRDASRVTLFSCHFHDLLRGVRVTSPDRICPVLAPAAPAPEPPILDPSATRLVAKGCTFEHVTETVIEARLAPTAIDLDDCLLHDYGTGISLFRAGASLANCQLVGGAAADTALHATSSRIEIARSTIETHAIGIVLDRNGGCEKPAGFIGNEPGHPCRLLGSPIMLTTSDAIAIDYNWWGTTDCTEVDGSLVGQTVGFVTDELGIVVYDCSVPVVPTTWSRIKAGLPR